MIIGSIKTTSHLLTKYHLRQRLLLTFDFSLTASSTSSTQNVKLINYFATIFYSSVPEGAPTSLQGYPINATAIQLAWEGIPPNLSSYKEKLLGYRIRYRPLGSRGYSGLNVSHNVTETVIKRLVPHTGYEIKVNGFNVIGYGPTSKVLIIKTLPSGKKKAKITFRKFLRLMLHSVTLTVLFSGYRWRK